MKSTAAILAAAMFVGDRMMASPSLAGAAAVAAPNAEMSFNRCPSQQKHDV